MESGWRRIDEFRLGWLKNFCGMERGEDKISIFHYASLRNPVKF